MSALKTSGAIPFIADPDPPYGAARQVSPLIRRIVAKNPSPFTYTGTGTYIVGAGAVAVIDPGPALPEHLDAIMGAVAGETVSHILITHTHLDHSPLAGPLAEKTGAPIFAYGAHGSGRTGGIDREEAVEEGADRDFRFDEALCDGDRIEGTGWTFEALHTPGHTSNHLCFALEEERALFTGDHVMGWSTTVISPPDGDMAAYMANLRRLLERDDRSLWPTHGLPVAEPKPFLEALIAHREERIAQILHILAAGPATIAAMVPRMYRDVPEYLHPAAARSVLAHLIQLVDEGAVQARDGARIDATYSLAGV